VETAVGKAATRRYETRKSGADSSQVSSLSLLVALRGRSGLVAKRKRTKGFFSKPYLQFKSISTLTCLPAFSKSNRVSFQIPHL